MQQTAVTIGISNSHTGCEAKRASLAGTGAVAQMPSSSHVEGSQAATVTLQVSLTQPSLQCRAWM